MKTNKPYYASERNRWLASYPLMPGGYYYNYREDPNKPTFDTVGICFDNIDRQLEDLRQREGLNPALVQALQEKIQALRASLLQNTDYQEQLGESKKLRKTSDKIKEGHGIYCERLSRQIKSIDRQVHSKIAKLYKGKAVAKTIEDMIDAFSQNNLDKATRSMKEFSHLGRDSSYSLTTIRLCCKIGFLLMLLLNPMSVLLVMMGMMTVVEGCIGIFAVLFPVSFVTLGLGTVMYVSCKEELGSAEQRAAEVLPVAKQIIKALKPQEKVGRQQAGDAVQADGEAAPLFPASCQP